MSATSTALGGDAGALDARPFTTMADPLGERLIREQLGEVRRRYLARYGSLLTHIVLFGGYGRGEGGLRRRGGRWVPHNNYDLLLVFAEPFGTIGRRLLQRDARRIAGALSATFGVGVDASVIGWRKLGRLPPAIMWFDLRHGHRLLHGEPNILAQLPRYELADIDRHDGLRLFVNRGALCLVNRLLLAGGSDCGDLVQKHLHKAVIGCGDGLLFFRGLYEPHYASRLAALERLSARDEIARDVIGPYREALDFRRAPSYRQASLDALRERNERLLGLFERVHAALQVRRPVAQPASWRPIQRNAVAPDLERAQPPSAALARRARALARNVGRFVRTRERPASGWSYPPEATLLCVFPAVAYAGATARARSAAARVLGSHDDGPLALARSYVELWGWRGDPNMADAFDTTALARAAS